MALAAGLWLGGCATTEAENGGAPDGAPSVAAIAGQFVGGVLAGFVGALGGYPQEGEYARSPTYSASASTQTSYHPVRTRHSHGHRRH